MSHPYFSCLILYDVCPKGRQRQLCYFKTLDSKWDTYDCAAQKQAIAQSTERQWNSADEQPKDIGNEGQGTAPILDFFSKGKKSQPCKLKTLAANRYADNRDTP